MGPCRKRFHRFWRTGNKGLDAAIAAIADPTAESQRSGFGAERPAKTDALYASVDGKAAGQQGHVRKGINCRRNYPDALSRPCRERWR